jgi:hypothetical protein
MTDMGDAKAVCLNSIAPTNCPTSATVYGYPFVNWTADLSSIPSAKWIWAANVTGATTSAGNAEFTFQTEFYLCGAPRDGTIAVAADDHAEVLLNGVSVAHATTPNSLSVFSVSASQLAQGINIIQITANNGPNPPDCTSDQYQCNPAGVVFGGAFSDALNAWPTCTDRGQTFTVGQSEMLPCPPGKIGSKSRPCICIGSNGIWGPIYDACVAPAVTCTGNGGMVFNVGDIETLPCPSGLTGAASRTCLASGGWGPTDSSNCVAPPQTCSGVGGTSFAAGTSETLPCPQGEVGAPPMTHTCLSNGTWGPTSGRCILPIVPAGAICGSSDKGLTGTCPAGTTCQSRPVPTTSPPWWCLFFEGRPFKPNECRRADPTQTADWFCDP